LILLPNRRHDSIGVKPLISDFALGVLLGGKGFDDNWLRAVLDDRSAIVVIPPKSSRTSSIDCDFPM
jgi:hypothetical protein